jgi:heme exporter protein A
MRKPHVSIHILGVFHISGRKISLFGHKAARIKPWTPRYMGRSTEAYLRSRTQRIRWIVAREIPGLLSCADDLREGGCEPGCTVRIRPFFFAKLRPMIGESAAALTGRGVTCMRGGRIVFAGLDFAFAPGELVVLRGPNGAGKSSLLRVMAGLVEPEAGTLAWNGSDIAEDPAAHRARLQYVGHLDALKPSLNAREHLRFHAALHDVEGQDIAAALNGFGLARLADRPTRFLSQGQKRRVALARLCVAPAALWLLDEPTNGLDADGVARLSAAIAAKRADGGIVIAATHLDFPGSDARTLTLGQMPGVRA